ncbi:AsmA family protein [Rickettsiales endosymbiont of Peranema trichophorum]|uniref:AsmA family protein n=1 Tax=Rickettsiales endosymbiont of Peranema trichophorum TaxID=2486577 RepID=UPI0013EE9E28|nr:AsmA family protein [Rickettsiales endosymbiont of Peranema trichophorum]
MTKCLGVSLVVVGLVTAVGVFSFGYVAKTLVVRKANQLMQVPVTLDDLSVSFFSGEVKITNIIVHNPKTYSAPHFLEAPSMRVVLEPLSILTSNLEINLIEIDSLKINLELNQNGGNYMDIMQNLHDSSKVADDDHHHDNHVDHHDGHGQSSHQHQHQHATKEWNVSVGLLKLNNTAVHMKAPGALELDATIPELHLKDLRSSDTSSMMYAIFNQLYPSFIKSNMGLKIKVEQTLDSIKKKLTNILN